MVTVVTAPLIDFTPLRVQFPSAYSISWEIHLHLYLYLPPPPPKRRLHWTIIHPLQYQFTLLSYYVNSIAAPSSS